MKHITKKDFPELTLQDFNEILLRHLYNICEHRKSNLFLLNKGEVTDLKKIKSYLEKSISLLEKNDSKLEDLLKKHSKPAGNKSFLEISHIRLKDIAHIEKSFDTNFEIERPNPQSKIISELFDFLLSILKTDKLLYKSSDKMTDFIELLVHKIQSKLFREGQGLTEGLPPDFKILRTDYDVVHNEKSSTRAYIIQLLKEFKEE